MGRDAGPRRYICLIAAGLQHWREGRATTTSTPNLADWLSDRVKEVRALQGELDGLGPPSVEQYAGVRGVEGSLNHLNQQVRARLLIDAPQWLAYYRKNPDWLSEHMLTGDGERQELRRLLDYTADQLNRIREDQ